MIVWPSNYHRVLLPPMCNLARATFPVLASRRVVLWEGKSRSGLRPGITITKDENYSAAVARNLTKTVPSVRIAFTYPTAFEDMMHAGNSRLMRLYVHAGFAPIHQGLANFLGSGRIYLTHRATKSS